MRLAKNHVDIGLFTNDIDAHTRFWGETCGLRLDHKLPLPFAKGAVQHRYDAHDSVIKVNHVPDPLPPDGPSGFVGLTIARAGKPVWEGRHPDGNRVRLVPPGTDGVDGIGITVQTPDPARMMDFYVRALEFDKIGPTTARCGDTMFFVVPGAAPTRTDDFSAIAFRYITIQIYDADAAMDQIISRGGSMLRKPQTLGKVARFGFVGDPDGNWIEISARASLTGIVPRPD